MLGNGNGENFDSDRSGVRILVGSGGNGRVVPSRYKEHFFEK